MSKGSLFRSEPLIHLSSVNYHLWRVNSPLGCPKLYFFKIYLFIYFYFWLCWVFVSVWGLSLVEASGGCSSSRCAGLSLSRPLLLQSTGSVVVAHGPSRSAACGIFPDQSSNPCPLHWQADSQPLHHQGSPQIVFLNKHSSGTYYTLSIVLTSFQIPTHLSLITIPW